MRPMRVLVTRARDQADAFAQRLASIGASVAYLPSIEIQPLADNSVLDSALQNLDRYKWLVLTSVNAVTVVLERLSDLGIETLPDGLQVAAVGPKTATSLEQGGISVDFVPVEYLGEAITPGLGDIDGHWILLPTADLAADTLPAAIMAKGGVAHVITAYYTVIPRPDPGDLASIQAGIDVLTFTSGSTARNFTALAREMGLDPFALPGNPKVACIGPKTASIAQELGFQVDIIPDQYTLDGLVAAIQSL